MPNHRRQQSATNRSGNPLPVTCRLLDRPPLPARLATHELTDQVVRQPARVAGFASAAAPGSKACLVAAIAWTRPLHESPSARSVRDGVARGRSPLRATPVLEIACGGTQPRSDYCRASRGCTIQNPAPQRGELDDDNSDYP